MSNLFNSKNYPEISRLFEFLAEVQDQGYATFIDYSGHVDYLRVKVTEDGDNFENEIYSGGHPTIVAWNPMEPEVVAVEIDRVISEIKEALAGKRESELKKLAELKAKYEPETQEN